MEEENDPDIINDVARVVGVLGDKNRKSSAPTRDRNVRKEQWTELYNQKSDEEFSVKMRINLLRLTSCLIPYGMGWS